MIRSNIIDKPRIGGARDLLGTDKYLEALIQFIKTAQLPTTVAIQGEWGSGKTSMMNQIRHQLCESTEKPEKEYYGIWLNTWQYSLMKTTDEAMISILKGITNEILEIINSKHESSLGAASKKVGHVLGVLAKAAAKTAISASGVSGDEVVDGVLSQGGNNGETTVLMLRDALQDVVNKCLEEDKKQGNNNIGFLFFIDDLDRIDPPVAVEILELIKNIFEVENCLFILAIDYDVVVKGLEPKFGPLTDKNEREFRSFFDKIIQLPFSMPLSNYSIDTFLIESLQNVNYISSSDFNDQDFKVLITEMALESVGTNPRALKRLINTLSLIQIMNEIEPGDFGEKRYEKLINFGLVCLQIAYPSIYALVAEEPNFIEWNDKTANKLRLKALNEDQITRLNETEEFDEDWEKVVFRACLNDHFLNNKAFNISTLLNTIKTLVPKEGHFEEEIEKVLTLSSVTSVSVEKQNKPPKFTKVRMSGWAPFENSLRQKGYNENIVSIVKSIHDYAEKEFSEHIIFQFTPNFLTLQTKNSKVKQKTFCWVKFQKKQVRLEGLNRFATTLPIITAVDEFNSDIQSTLQKAMVALNNGE
jgi:predicted KAP-like P-loop ATPase